MKAFAFFLMVFISFQAYGEIPYGWIVSFDIIMCVYMHSIYVLTVSMFECVHVSVYHLQDLLDLLLSLYVSVSFLLKVDRFLMKCISRPQQLSTYALTLYKYTTTINGQTILVGKFGIKNNVILVYKNFAVLLLRHYTFLHIVDHFDEVSYTCLMKN